MDATQTSNGQQLDTSNPDWSPIPQSHPYLRICRVMTSKAWLGPWFHIGEPSNEILGMTKNRVRCSSSSNLAMRATCMHANRHISSISSGLTFSLHGFTMHETANSALILAPSASKLKRPGGCSPPVACCPYCRWRRSRPRVHAYIRTRARLLTAMLVPPLPEEAPRAGFDG